MFPIKEPLNTTTTIHIKRKGKILEIIIFLQMWKTLGRLKKKSNFIIKYNRKKNSLVSSEQTLLNFLNTRNV